MSFRVVLIENQMDIKVKLDNLVFIKDEGEVRIPVSDISTIVIDNLNMNISMRTLCLLAQNNVGVIICDQEHLPIGFYSSYDNHSRISKKIGFQINRSKEFYDKLWADIVRAKLINQAQVIKILNKSSQAYENIKSFAEGVLEGDPTNRESHGAKVYFNELMGRSFSRGNPDILLNSGLDYGYTIIRSYLARLCVGYGLNSQLGIHHRNEYNRFNLVDDMIEPIRPIVDLYIYNLMKDENFFTGEHRKAIINMLNHKIVYKDRKMFMCNMMEEYISSIANYIEGKKGDIIYPSVEDYCGEKDEI